MAQIAWTRAQEMNLSLTERNQAQRVEDLTEEMAALRKRFAELKAERDELSKALWGCAYAELA